MFWNRITLVLLAFFLFQWNADAQNKRVEDSLRGIFLAEPEKKAADLELLNRIATESQNPDTSLKYADLLAQGALKASNRKFLVMGYQIKGTSWRLKGEFDRSLDFLFQAAALAEDLGLEKVLGDIVIEIGNTYSESGDNGLAATYYSRGLEWIKKSGDSIAYGLALYNKGDNLFEKGQVDSAFAYTQRATEIFDRFEKEQYKAYGLGNLGRIYASKGENDKAEKFLNASIASLEAISDYNGMTDFLASMADVYRQRGNLQTAIRYAERSLAAAEKYRLKQDLRDKHFLVSDLYEEAGDLEEALDHFKKYIIFRDSVQNLRSVQDMARLRSDFEIAKKQAELNFLQEQKKNQETLMVATGIALFLILLLALGLYRRNKFIGRTNKIIEREKTRSELLLLNILPEETAQELKESGKVKAKRFDSVTILFTDFRNFTYYAESLSPEALVESVDFYFTEFDRIVDKYGLEKIKTVGDAYMCAAGVPFHVEDHAVRTVGAACEMMEFVEHAKDLDTGRETRFDIRIGINSGPVIAGVVGHKKFAYDIWGDAVNIASRMESSSENGHINISENTYQLVQDRFDCIYRGEVDVKHKGKMKMYYVTGKKSNPHSGAEKSETFKN